MIIREERIADYSAVGAVIEAAFADCAYSDHTEHTLVCALRKSDAFIPALSLVAEVDRTCVGYILFTRVDVGETAALALAPLAVLPVYQRQGIGTALIGAGHRIAAALGYGYSIVLGSAQYYPRFGYVPSETYGIGSPFAVPAEQYMAARLREDAPCMHGIPQYDSAFGIE